MTSRQKTFWTILALFVLLSVWWTFHFPYDRNRLFLVVPGNASFVSEHRKLASRWKNAAHNPMIQQGLVASGVEQAELDKILRDPGITALVKLVAPRDTLLVFTPHFHSSEPAWLFSSWIGGREKLLTWNIVGGAMSDFHETPTVQGRKAWVMDLQDSGPYSSLTISVVEGLLVGCLSSNSTDIDYLIRAVESRRERGAEVITRLDFPSESKLSDMGWVDLERVGSGFMGLSTLRFAFSELDNKRAIGWVRSDLPLPSSDSTHDIREKDLKDLNSFLGNVPDAVVMAPFANIRRYSQMPDTPRGLKAVGLDLASIAPEDSIMFLSLQGGSFSVRVQKLAFPSLAAGLKVKNGKDALSAVPGLLQKINIEYNTAFVPRHSEIAGRPAIVLESAKKSQYAGFGPRQKPTFSVDGDWLVLASNMDILEKFFQKKDIGKGSLAGEINSHGSLAYSWIDLKATGSAIENALAVYSLALWFDSSEKGAATRKNLSNIIKWNDVVRLMKSCTLYLDSDGSSSTLRFNFGE